MVPPVDSTTLESYPLSYWLSLTLRRAQHAVESVK